MSGSSERSNKENRQKTETTPTSTPATRKQPSKSNSVYQPPKPGEEQSAEYPDHRRCFVLMPFGSKDEGSAVQWQTQNALFHLLIFAVNDAFYQNYVNRAIRHWRPILLERADIGAGSSADLLDNVLRKIDDSDFCIVDYTHDNLNVALESGYAIAHDKFLLPITQELPLTEEPHDEKNRGVRPRVSDLAGKLMYVVTMERLLNHHLWDAIWTNISSESVVMQQPAFFTRQANLVQPFSDASHSVNTFLLACLRQSPSLLKESSALQQIQEYYREDIVRPLYRAFRPLSDKLESGAIEVEFPCMSYATREAAKLSESFVSARRRIRILTTNLKGLVGYIVDIAQALGDHKETLEVDILTLNPDSEFVNARGQLIGRDIARFRREMHDSLRLFRTELKEKWPANVAIKTYSEFPTQITFFVDDSIYSSVVSVNHQSRHNIVFMVPAWRKGVAESFLQHWDTIWARAVEVGS